MALPPAAPGGGPTPSRQGGDSSGGSGGKGPSPERCSAPTTNERQTSSFGTLLASPCMSPQPAGAASLAGAGGAAHRLKMLLTRHSPAARGRSGSLRSGAADAVGGAAAAEPEVISLLSDSPDSTPPGCCPSAAKLTRRPGPAQLQGR
eukprot:357949-Chlamydomonas_euryale.AAC.8